MQWIQTSLHNLCNYGMINHQYHQTAQGLCSSDSSCPPFVLSHLSPAEFAEVLSEVRRMEERLRPFIERTHSILGAATSADYNNNVRKCNCMKEEEKAEKNNNKSSSVERALARRHMSGRAAAAAPLWVNEWSTRH